MFLITHVDSNNFQFELFYDCTIRLTVLKLSLLTAADRAFRKGGECLRIYRSEFKLLSFCVPRWRSHYHFATEGVVFLSLQGQVSPTPRPERLQICRHPFNQANLRDHLPADP